MINTVQDETLQSVTDKIVKLGHDYENMSYLEKVNSVGYAIKLLTMFAELTNYEITKMKGNIGGHG